MADKKQTYTVYNRNTGKHYTTDKTPDDAKSGGLFSFGKGEELPFDWKPWLMAGGGGVLSYLAAKSMVNDGEEKKEKKSVWMKLLPYLIGTAGAAGGYALAKHAEEGDVYYENDENGNPIMPWKPTGTLADLAGWGAYAGAGAQAAHLAAGVGRRNNETAARYVDAIDAEARRDAFRKTFGSTREEAIKARDLAANRGNVLGDLQRAANPNARAIAAAQTSLGEATAAYDSAWRKYQSEAAEMGRLNNAARTAINNAGTEYPNVRAIALRPAEPKSGKGGATITPTENAYLKSLRANAAKTRPVAGGSVVGNYVRRTLNALGRDAHFKGGRWFNGARGLAPLAAMLGIGYGAHALGDAQNEDRAKMLEDFKNMGIEPKK